MNENMFLVFLIIYIINIFYILKEDLDTKYIPLLGFYPFVVMSGVYYYLHFGHIVGVIPIALYLLAIVSLDIIEYKKGPLSSIGEKWKFLDTGIYDYFLYIFIGDIIISEVVTNFGTFEYLVNLLIIFITTGIVSYFFLKIHQKKVKTMMIQENILSWEALDEALYNRKLQKISLKNAWEKNLANFSSKEQEEIFIDYTYRVPLFLFGNTFILSFIIIQFL